MKKVQGRLLSSMNQTTSDKGGYLFLETAGGVHSPVMSGTSQADFYRPLRLPTVLIGDSRLGGISTTISSYESLHLRGYDVPSILLFDEKHKNHTLLSERLDSTFVAAIPPPPSPLHDPIQEERSMTAYYTRLDEHLLPVIRHLDEYHQARFDRLEQMAQKSRTVFWWPFTQHENVKQVTLIDSAHEDYFVTYSPKVSLPLSTSEPVFASASADLPTSTPTPAPTSAPLEAKTMFDSCASWWTQGLGHANPHLTLAAAHAAGRYGHVIFPESTHEPSLSLAEAVLEHDTWASRVFFSDNGSTAMEVSLKMAISAAAKRYHWTGKHTPIDILGIEGSYHGDTIGAMDTCSPNTYNDQVQWYQPRGHWLKPPSVHISKGKTYIRVPKEIAESDKEEKWEYNSLDAIYSGNEQRIANDSTLVRLYDKYITTELELLRIQGRQIGALLMEPVIMGAGGMIFVDPLFQHLLVNKVRYQGAKLLGYHHDSLSSQEKGAWRGLPVVFDEVFSGWYRLGRRSASEFLGVTPDIVSYAKTLTGGLLPLALTVTKESIYDVFLSKNKPDCLLHGHSYTAHPMGCAVAKESIQRLDQMASPTGAWSPFRESWNGSAVWSMWSRTVIDRLSHLHQVESVMSLGSVLAVELKDDKNKGYGSEISQSLVQKMRTDVFADGINLYARPLGNIVYLMTSQITTPERVRQCERILMECLEA
ncbi:pyridoxal phosphate-dependent transferase [Spinellus fusiger]|nr:pyridoxal phosphate-dependent transferase [Spinellus fusiger]